jgi:hypothetical protein
MSDTTQLVIEAPRSTIERLAGEALLLRRTAAALAFVTPDGSPVNRTQAKYAAEAVAYRLVAEQFAWPVTTEAFTEGLQRIGVARADALEIAAQLQAERSLCIENEMPSATNAADFLLSRLGAAPYLNVKGIRPVDAPTAPEPVAVSGPPERDLSPVTTDLEV